MPTQPSTTVFPVIAILISSTLWGVYWYPLRLLEAQGLAGLWATLLIFTTALGVGLLAVWRRGSRVSSHPALLFVLAAASGWCNVAFILAVLEGNVVRVILLFYLAPIWTILLGRFILAERLTATAKITLGVAMIGAIIMLWDPHSGVPWPQDHADWLAISSGMAFAMSNVMVRKLYDEDIWVKTIFAWLGVVIVAGSWIVLAQLPWPQVSPAVVSAAMVGCGLAMVVMTLLVLYGLTHMPAHRAAVILLFELVAAALSAQWLTDEVVLLQEWLGGLMIVVAAYFAARSQLRGSC